MLKFKLRRVRLIFAYIIGVSVILILLICLLGVISTRSLVSLGHYAESTNRNNIKQETYTLIFENTEVLGKNFSSMFSSAQNLASIMSKLSTYYLYNPSDYHKSIRNESSTLKFVKENSYLVDQNKKNDTILCYWGDAKTVPKVVINEARALSYNIKLISLIYSTYSIYNQVWINVLKDKYFIKSPANLSETQSTPKSLFNIYFTKEYNKYRSYYARNPDLKNEAIWTKPKSVIFGKNKIISVQYPIFGRMGTFHGFSGIDINIDNLFNTVLASDLSFDSSKATRSWEPFLLMGDTTIVEFPKNLYKPFGLSDSKIKKNYIKYNYDTKILDSQNKLIVKLGDEIKHRSDGIIEININKKKYLIAFCKIDTNNWVVGTIVPADQLYDTIAQTNLKTNKIISEQITQFIGVSVLFLFGAIILSVAFFKHLVLSPIIELRNVVKKIGKGVFNSEFKARGITELVELSRGIKVLGRELTEFTEDLKNDAKERQAIETELNIAAKIQRSVLPKIRSRFLRKEFELDAKLVPSRIVSGDFYDFFYINKNTIVIVLADISGKGVSSAFFMNMAKSIIKSLCLKDRYHNPGRILNRVNRELSKDNEACMFLTMYLAYYNIKTGKLTYSNAGHHDIIRTNSKGKISFFGILGDPAICLNPTTSYKVAEKNLDVGDTIVFYTDGISEAMNPQHEDYGEARVADLISKNCNEEAKDISAEVLKDIIKFERGARFDDITLLVLKRKK
ncbi:MAG TPA: SpoIIE family protein phosphatase [Victivallales bacterium]|nr:SpoIIE family protein phosphatase [Victivallales bacterium]